MSDGAANNNQGPTNHDEKPNNSNQPGQNADPNKEKRDDFAKEVKKDFNQQASQEKREDLKDQVQEQDGDDRGIPQDARQDMPINPFASKDTSLPTNQYEDQREDEDQVELEPADQDQEIESADVTPINPFATDDATPDRTLDRKSLDQVGEVEKVKDESQKVDKKEASVEGRHEAEEKAEDDSKQEMVEPEVVEAKPRESEPIEGEAIDDEDQNHESLKRVAEADEFPDEVWAVLAQAGITKRGLLIGLVVFLLLIGGLTYYLFGSTGDGDVNQGGSRVVVEDTKDNDDREDQDQEDDSGDAAGSIGDLLGVEAIGTHGDISGIKSVLAVGKTFQVIQGSEFVEYMSLLQKMQNIYETDIYNLLDQSVDRRRTLEEHIEELKTLIAQGQTNLSEIQDEMAELSASYQSVVEERDAVEASFFDSLQNLEANQADQDLNKFILLENQAADLKARFNAYQAVEEMYVNSLGFLIPRAEDVESNTDALLQGIRVFDIPGSDIDAIIRLGE